MLWLLPKAAPALLRHLAAYVELASLDLEVTRREFEAKIFASVLLGICALFLLLMICLLVVACTWDTPYRVTAIAAGRACASLQRGSRKNTILSLGAPGMVAGSRSCRANLVGRGLSR
jgi:uncharacterized membrane protein YqjE